MQSSGHDNRIGFTASSPQPPLVERGDAAVWRVLESPATIIGIMLALMVAFFALPR